MELRNTREGQSIVDYLIRMMPDFAKMKAKQMVDPMAARALFAVWKDEKNKVAAGIYKRPISLSSFQIEAMEKAGLVKLNGEKLEITQKGADVIKVMVLGDNSSIFDKSDDRIIDYAEALKNTKSANTRRGNGLSKKASNDWWDRFE